MSEGGLPAPQRVATRRFDSCPGARNRGVFPRRRNRPNRRSRNLPSRTWVRRTLCLQGRTDGPPTGLFLSRMTALHNQQYGGPAKQGLYDPRQECDSCGVGFVVDIKGRKSHQILQQAIQVLRNLDHRGAGGCEVNTGDGAGVLIQMPHAFFEAKARKAGIDLPAPGQYGAGLVFLPRDPHRRRRIEERFRADRRRPKARRCSAGATCRRTIHRSATTAKRPSRSCARSSSARQSGADATTWPSSASSTSSASAPTARSAPRRSTARSLVRRQPVLPDDHLQGHARRRAGRALLPRPARPGRWRRALALVHSRFSTNTFPSWDRAHPYRYIAHNGEINTLRGNINWMHARAGAVRIRAVRRRPARRSCRSSTRTAATRRCSTTRSSCSCWPAARCRTR